ncbi:SWI/SNF complex subunit SWI3C [Triticum urartu]|uniref:SWI/SNF complex subunit SWI3C n=1 Tax=Triticum urartu TaxID=4572 RepID=M7YQY5_TRIUA|nr:SWI/SNF complex subunit SWI3C [Triticum urartu]
MYKIGESKSRCCLSDCVEREKVEHKADWREGEGRAPGGLAIGDLHLRDRSPGGGCRGPGGWGRGQWEEGTRNRWTGELAPPPPRSCCGRRRGPRGGPRDADGDGNERKERGRRWEEEEGVGPNRTSVRPQRSVGLAAEISVIAADRALAGGASCASAPPAPALENISHGQLQVLAAMLPDHPSLSNDPDKPSSYVCTVPPLMECQGVPKQFYSKLLVVPRHADWFSPATVHRLERQVVPHFFSGKSPGHTPEKYIMLRNKVIVKYLERPSRRLAFAECQGLVTSTAELYDLSRIVRFLDTWGIINYLAAGSVHRGLRLASSLIREEQTGELQLASAPLKSIDGLILFDRPKCSARAEDIASVASTSSALEVPNGDTGFADLDEKIWERLSENFCSYCSQPLPSLHYESQKEADISLCLDCFHDARFVPGHSSLDFERVDGTKDGSDNDGDSWTHEETLLLLEGLEKYNDNWNAIAEHVGTKSKAQCIHHFIRIPVEDGLLESIEVPEASVSSRVQSNGFSYSNSNGGISGSVPQSSQPGQQLPFVNSANPVMSLVAFLASAVGPRIAASCANAALSVLTRDDSSWSEAPNLPGGVGFGVVDDRTGASGAGRKGIVAALAWHETLAWLRIPAPIPSQEPSLTDWWRQANEDTPPTLRKALKSVALLVPWMIWKHRNSCVFDNAMPFLNTLLDSIKDEARSWAAAGAPGLRLVLPQTWDVH